MYLNMYMSEYHAFATYATSLHQPVIVMAAAAAAVVVAVAVAGAVFLVAAVVKFPRCRQDKTWPINL